MQQVVAVVLSLGGGAISRRRVSCRCFGILEMFLSCVDGVLVPRACRNACERGDCLS
jgi:hypothetical protein